MSKHSRTLVCVVPFLVLLLSVCVVAVLLAKHFYAQARMTATFPSHAAYFQANNRSLPAKDRKRIVLFGDSRVVQWTNFPGSGFLEVVSRGINGETTAQMRTRFDQDVLGLDPDVVVLQLGINDLTTIGALPDRAAEIARQCDGNIRYFVETLLARGIRTILLTIIPPADPGLLRLPVWSGQIAAEVEKINSYWLHAAPRPLLHVVDTRSALQDDAGRWRDGVNADTLHLTSRGYEYLNGAIAPLIRE
jgi:lysophospholipase L1-like esterase